MIYGPILAGAGIIGIALGLSAQSIVKDIINGMFILLENHFNVGDVIRVAGVAGLVESMSLRVVTLRDLEGRVHIIPNGAISVVTNMTKEWSRCLLGDCCQIANLSKKLKNLFANLLIKGGATNGSKGG